jgi:hypothetical protein
MALIDKETFMTHPESMGGFPVFETKSVKEAVLEFEEYLKSIKDDIEYASLILKKHREIFGNCEK